MKIQEVGKGQNSSLPFLWKNIWQMIRSPSDRNIQNSSQYANYTTAKDLKIKYILGSKELMLKDLVSASKGDADVKI